MERRRYDSTARREQAAGTRERIVAAGADLLHGSTIRDWRALTIRAVAERAGVNERTVYRHFANERGLRDAVMHRLEDEAGIDLTAMRLDDVGAVAARILDHVATYPLPSRPSLDPTLTDANQRQRAALLAAVDDAAPGWSASDRTAAAAVLDVLWSMATYERLVADWHLGHADAARAVGWVIDLVTTAVDAGNGVDPDARHRLSST